jgi:hypothetical protein
LCIARSRHTKNLVFFQSPFFFPEKLPEDGAKQPEKKIACCDVSMLRGSIIPSYSPPTFLRKASKRDVEQRFVGILIEKLLTFFDVMLLHSVAESFQDLWCASAVKEPTLVVGFRTAVNKAIINLLHPFRFRNVFKLCIVLSQPFKGLFSFVPSEASAGISLEFSFHDL